MHHEGLGVILLIVVVILFVAVIARGNERGNGGEK